MSLEKEAEFFKAIAPQVRELVASAAAQPAIAKHKATAGDYATEVDVAVEDMIVSKLSESFPDDAVLAEESHSETVMPEGRIWIIDPICGTSNLARGLANFCTNIALADNNELIASCVVDHSAGVYYWSVGNSEIYVADKLYVKPERTEEFGKTIEVDLGCWPSITDAKKEKMSRVILEVGKLTGYSLLSLNSSLGFAYTALGKLDGFINAAANPWDICAGSFLVQQSGGKITDFDGLDWHIDSVGTIAAGNEDIHRALLAAVKSV